MNELSKRLLAEKLVDDFYDEDVRENAESVGDELSEQLKTIFRWINEDCCFYGKRSVPKDAGKS